MASLPSCSGRCWSSTDGPIWECKADCNAVYGASGYCHHGALPGEGAGTPICASTFCCDLGGKLCAQEGLFCNVDTGDCENECNGELDNPHVRVAIGSTWLGRPIYSPIYIGIQTDIRL